MQLELVLGQHQVHVNKAIIQNLRSVPMERVAARLIYETHETPSGPPVSHLAHEMEQQQRLHLLVEHILSYNVNKSNTHEFMHTWNTTLRKAV